MSKRGAYRLWTDGEREYILANAWKITQKKMAEALGRTHKQVMAMSAYLRKMAGRRYRDGRTPCSHCGKIVHRRMRNGMKHIWCDYRCSNAFYNGRGKAQRKARGDRRNLWTSEQLEFLREHYGRLTGPELARELGRGLRAVYIVAFRMGLRDPRLWQSHEDAFLSRNKSRGYRWCAEQLGRSIQACRTRAKRLGIQPVDPIRNRWHQTTMLRHHGIDSPGRLRHRRAQQARKGAVAAVHIDKLGKALEAVCPQA